MMRNFKTIIFLFVFICATFSSAVTCAEKFNVGMYGIWACENKDNAFKLLKDNGFNIASGVGNVDVLNKAHKYKIQCLVGIDTQATEDVAGDPGRWKKYIEEVIQQVTKLKDHPAVFAWYFLDEPTWHKISVSKIKGMNQRIRAIDAKHPIFTVLSTPESWQSYLPLFDIIGIDPYLKADKSKPDSKPEIVRDWIRKIKHDLKSIKGKKPEIWSVLGAFDSKPKKIFAEPYFRKPEPHEYKKMVELALSEKVDGIMIYTLAYKNSDQYTDWHLPTDDPELWEVVKGTPNMIKK
jgi:hypothetical protein